MKKLLGIGVLVLATGFVHAQGYLTLANNTARRVNNVAGTAGAPVGTKIGLYIVPAGTAPGVGGNLAASATINLAPGIFNLGSVPVAGTAIGDTINVQIRAWVTGTSYETATDFFGSSTTFSVGPLTAAPPTPSPSTGAGAWTPFQLVAVPEPSTIALGLLGLGALALFRRRK